MFQKISLLIFAVFFFAVLCSTESLFIAAPGNVTVDERNATSLSINWEEVNDVNDTILGYRVRHHKNSTSGLSGNCSYSNNSSHSNSSCYNNNSSLFVCKNRTHALLTELEVYTYYWVEVIAFTNGTFGNASIIRVFRTDEGVPTRPPRNISATAPNDNSTRITVSWGVVPRNHRRGKIIGFVVIIIKHDGGDPRQLNVTTRHVDIDDLEKFTFYNVTVSARTSKGVSNASAVFSIRTTEDAPESPPVDITANITARPNSTSDYIVISWGPVQEKLNGILRAYKIRWRPASQTTNYTERRINITSSSSPSSRRKKRDISEPSNEREFQLKNLSIYTNYSVEVAAVTVKEGVYSKPVYFLSQEGVPLLPPGNVTAFNTSSTTIMVTWSPPEESSIQGVLLGYEITFTPAWKNASASRKVMLCKRNTSFELERLNIYTLYNITVAAFTRVGIGNESEIKQVWTDEERPKAPPQKVTAVSKTFSSIHVTWEPVPEEKRHGKIIKYEVKVLKCVSGAWQNQTRVFTTNRTAVIQNLTMFVTYSIEVRAYTRIGPGNYSDPKTLMTLETAPSVVPTNVSAKAISRTAVVVTWEIEGLEPGFVIRQCIISYRKLKHGAKWNLIYTDSLDRHATLTGLRTFTTYEIKVAAATNLTGNYSEPVNVTTHESAPQGAPENVTAVPETVSSIRVSWYPVPKGQRNGTISQYNVRVENSSGVIRNVTVRTDNLTVVIDGLEMYVTYFFQVQAFTSQGGGPFSPVVNQTTIQTAPDVVLNVTATATSNSTIEVTGDIAKIHHHLEVNGLKIEYCALRPDGKDLPNRCFASADPCEEKLVTNMTSYNVPLIGLRSYIKYRIRVQAINITAEDGTVVTTPYGNYSNPVDETTHEGVPGAPPSNVQAIPYSTTSIEVKWGRVDVCKRNGKVIEYNIMVYNSSWDKIQFFNVNDSMHFVVVENLEYANYSARVQAVTIKGTGPFSEYQTTTTHQPAPRVVPENVSAVTTGNSTIRVEWSFTGISSNIGFQGFFVKYEAIGHPDRNGRTPVDGHSYATTLTGLRMFTKYKIQVAARTTQAGNYSNAVYATTWEGVPTAPPSPIDAQILDSTFVEISWGKVPSESHNGKILGFYIIYYQAGNDSYQQSKRTHYDFFSVQLKSLGKFSEYHVKVLAFTKAGNGTAGNISFVTSDDVPSAAPIKLKPVSFVSPYKIQVSWEQVPKEFMNGRLVNYHVTYQRVKVGGERKEYEPVLEMTVERAVTSVVLENLEPFSEYKITVAAKTAKGLGPYALYRYGETCRCIKRLTTSWRRYEPYVNFTDDGQPAQIIPLVLQSMVKQCCGHCDEHNQTILDFETNGRNRPSTKNTSRDLLQDLDEFTDFTFPVFGHKDQDSYKGGFGFTPVIESAGVAFIVYPNVSTTQTTMFRSLLRCLPVLLLPIVTAYIAGVIIWCLERINNPQDFPPSFLLGTWEGVWWSFVSMTTLGYGDRAPLSYKGRIFAILWILFGLVVIAVTMAMLTTALTAVTVNSEPKLYGSKIAAEHNSPEYNVGTRRNAKYDPDKEYHSIEEVVEALFNKEVEGILVDTYSAGLRGDLFNRPPIRVSKVIDYKTAYGVVLSPNATRLGKCFENYMNSHRAEIFKMIKEKAKPIETSSSNKPAKKEATGGLLDSGSSTFNKALRYACIMLGIVLCLSLIYECIRRIRGRQKVHQKVHFKTILLKEMRSVVEEFIQRMKQTKAKLGEKHRKQIIRFWKLKRKSMCSSGNESEWLRIAMTSPHKGDVTVTDL